MSWASGHTSGARAYDAVSAPTVPRTSIGGENDPSARIRDVASTGDLDVIRHADAQRGSHSAAKVASWPVQGKPGVADCGLTPSPLRQDPSQWTWPPPFGYASGVSRAKLRSQRDRLFPCPIPAIRVYVSRVKCGELTLIPLQIPRLPKGGTASDSSQSVVRAVVALAIRTVAPDCASCPLSSPHVGAPRYGGTTGGQSLSGDACCCTKTV